jgi:hypothetical protein
MFQYKNILFLSVFVLVVKQSSQSPVRSSETIDLDVNLSCVANATCIKNVSNKVFRALNMKQTIDFGLFTVEPMKNEKKVEGRSMSKIWNFAVNNAIRVPLGAYSLSVQRSEEHENYLEIAVSKPIEGK